MLMKVHWCHTLKQSGLLVDASGILTKRKSSIDSHILVLTLFFVYAKNLIENTQYDIHSLIFHMSLLAVPI